MSKQNCDSWKGIFAILIVLHHISQQYTVSDSWLNYSPLPYIGKWAVAGFLMISGYGLFAQFLIKGSVYKKGFFNKRLVKILPSFILLSILSNIYLYYADNLPLSLQFHNFITEGVPPLWNSWFMYAIVYEYVILYLAMRATTKPKLLCVYLLMGNIIYYIVLNELNFGIYWTSAIFAFNVGNYVALKYDSIQKFNKRKILAYSLIIFILLITCNRILNKTIDSQTILFSVNHNIEAYLCYFVIPVVLYALPIISNRLCRYFGKISFNLYLCHGFFIVLAVKFGMNLIWGFFFVSSLSLLTSALLTRYVTSEYLSKALYKFNLLIHNILPPPPSSTR